MSKNDFPKVETRIEFPFTVQLPQSNVELWKLIINELEEIGRYEEFKELEIPNDRVTKIQLIATYSIAMVCVLGVSFLPSFTTWLASTLFVFPIMGAVHCIIGNYYHNTNHGGSLTSVDSNKLLGRFLAATMLYSDEYFTVVHDKHHNNLGKEGLDEEMITLIPLLKPNDGGLKSFLKFTRTFFLSGKAWINTMIADLPLMIRRGHGNIICDKNREKWETKLNKNLSDIKQFWSYLLGGLMFVGLLTKMPLLLAFIFVWFGSKAMSYHIVRCWRELFDHFGLPINTTILEYTRSMPHNSIFNILFNGLNDDRHVVHHLFKKIPMANLSKAHELLMQTPTYANNVKMYDNYFWGPNAVFASMVQGIKANLKK